MVLKMFLFQKWSNCSVSSLKGNSKIRVQLRDLLLMPFLVAQTACSWTILPTHLWGKPLVGLFHASMPVVVIHGAMCAQVMFLEIFYKLFQAVRINPDEIKNPNRSSGMAVAILWCDPCNKITNHWCVLLLLLQLDVTLPNRVKICIATSSSLIHFNGSMWLIYSFTMILDTLKSDQ